MMAALINPHKAHDVRRSVGENGVSIQSMEQSGFGDEARLSFLTHMALTDSVNATMKDLAKHASVDSIGACLRVIDGGRE